MGSRLRALLILLFVCTSVRAWDPPLLHLSDLPTFVSKLVVPPVASAPISRCNIHSSCGKCLDASGCVWCSVGGCVERQSALQKMGDQCVEQCPFWTTELITTATIISMLALLSAGGGIGGGALFIPVFLMVYHLTTHEAVPLSKVTIFGLSCGGFLVLYFKRHPSRDAPLIDYDVSLLLIPPILAGTIVGVYLNVIFPSFVIALSLVPLLAVSSLRTWTKAFEIHGKESESASANVEEVEMTNYSLVANADVDSDLAAILEAESKTPVKKFVTFSITYFGLIGFVLLKGSNKGPSIIGIHCGSVPFFILLSIGGVFLFFITMYAARLLRKQNRERESAGYRFGDHDVRYTRFSVFLIPILGFFSGIAAGFLGIGAGLVVAPIMLELGILPEVAQASSSFTILFTSSSTSLQFIMLGKLPYRAAVLFWTIGFIGSIIGQNLVAYLIQKCRRQSYVTFFLAGMISLSAFAMLILNAHHLSAHGFEGHFSSPCDQNIG